MTDNTVPIEVYENLQKNRGSCKMKKDNTQPMQNYKCNSCGATWSESTPTEFWVSQEVYRTCTGCLHSASDRKRDKPLVFIRWNAKAGNWYISNEGGDDIISIEYCDPDREFITERLERHGYEVRVFEEHDSEPVPDAPEGYVEWLLVKLNTFLILTMPNTVEDDTTANEIRRETYKKVIDFIKANQEPI